MKDSILALWKDFEEQIKSISNASELDAFRIQYLSRKGKIQALFDNMKSVQKEARPLIGRLLNQLKLDAETRIQETLSTFSNFEKDKDRKQIDISLPGREIPIGHSHIVTSTIQEIISIFENLGFSVAIGPELETDFYNFEALNFPKNHPARDMQDTFFITDNLLLRTHTTPVQIRVMEKQKPPIRIIMPGRVFRNESISARSHVQFHQVDGLFVDKNVSFADLKGTLISFAKQFYGSNLKYRFRPSFFPFTEPSAEMDITCYLCNGDGCRVCKCSGWLEILGCGMVDPNVFQSVHLDHELFSGYAFGIGIERTAMLRHGITDIRLLFENDLRVNHQFN